ncbi:MAG: hypothetical protein A2W91_00445 [Bacteroidetes bacterium GWF2_38_335]|nr:MAG: hypothetical protein A2W91_00445 [Bacteroidetes bacterium GWF2_38_335]OFY78302.1 MAG: hypothetical protein A2281_03825 [Bacteroidetes bacterium RIFOXYA12_FULL_38_20]HBS87503.1 hypothetical protein [Bacteroidales bacterium]
MFRAITLIFLVVFQGFVFSQSSTPEYEKIMTNEAFVLDVSQLNWMSPPTGMKIEPYSSSINVFAMYPLAGRRYNISLASGFGIGTDNMKSNYVPVYEADQTISLRKLPDGILYDNNKFSVVYFDVPLELRIRTNPRWKKRNFKISFGAKAGYLIQTYHKYRGEDYHQYSFGDYVKFKQYRIKNVMHYRYGVYGRIGYGKFMFYGYYSLTQVFKTNLGPEITPFAVGITIVPIFKNEIHYKEYRSRILSDN